MPAVSEGFNDSSWQVLNVQTVHALPKLIAETIQRNNLKLHFRKSALKQRFDYLYRQCINPIELKRPVVIQKARMLI